MVETLSEYTGITGLLMFFFFFVGMTVYLLRPGAKQTYKDCADIPFREDSHDGRQ